jgi:hypothetical protein
MLVSKILSVVVAGLCNSFYELVHENVDAKLDWIPFICTGRRRQTRLQFRPRGMAIATWQRASTPLEN